MATTGAASVLAGGSPPSLVSCAMLRISTRAPAVDEATCSLFAAIERVTCTAPACGGLRRMGARICNRCGQASQARPPRVGDVIMGPLGAPSSQRGRGYGRCRSPLPRLASLSISPLLTSPTGFTQRIRALPSSTDSTRPRQLSPAHDQRGGTIVGTAWLRDGMTTLSWRKAAPSSCCPRCLRV